MSEHTRLTFTIPGKPVGWKAPKRGRGKSMFTPADYRAWRDAADLIIQIAARGATIKTPCRLLVTIYADNLAADGTNIKKGVEDSLVRAGRDKKRGRQGVLFDDSLKYLHESTFRLGGEDKKNPRVIILLETIGE